MVEIMYDASTLVLSSGDIRDDNPQLWANFEMHRIHQHLNGIYCHCFVAETYTGTIQGL